MPGSRCLATNPHCKLSPIAPLSPGVQEGGEPVRTTRFRVWFQPSVKPTELDRAVWSDVKIVQKRAEFGFDALDVTVQGDGSNLRRLVVERQDVFAALLELRPGDE